MMKLTKTKVALLLIASILLGSLPLLAAAGQSKQSLANGQSADPCNLVPPDGQTLTILSATLGDENGCIEVELRSNAGFHYFGGENLGVENDWRAGDARQL